MLVGRDKPGGTGRHRVREEYNDGTRVCQGYTNRSPALSPSSPKSQQFMFHCILQIGSRNKRGGLPKGGHEFQTLFRVPFPLGHGSAGESVAEADPKSCRKRQLSSSACPGQEPWHFHPLALHYTYVMHWKSGVSRTASSPN